MRSKFLAVAVLSLAMNAASAHAASLYVSLSGNDANPGTLASPYRTLNKAGQMARPGDVVNVRGGVYNERVNIMSKGTSAARITFRSYPGETAIYDGTGQASGTVLFSLNQTDYVDASGFEIRNSPFIGISVWMTKNTRVLNNVVHNIVRNGIYVGADGPGISSDATIEGNQIYNCVTENSTHSMQSSWASTLSIQYTERTRVANNKIWNNDGEAIAVINSNYINVVGNEAFDNFSEGVFIDNSRFNTVDGNLIYSTGNTRYFRDGYPGVGIGIANETYSISNPSSDNKFINNIVVNTRWAIFYGNFERGGGLKNTTIANNTFYKSSNGLIEIWQDTHSNSVVENNIFYQVGGTAVSLLQGSGVTFRNNHWYGGTPAANTAGAGDVYGNPAFVNAGGTRATDYKLTAGSLAIARALDVTSLVSTDYFGNPRVAPFDMGAHQFSAAGTVLDTQAPTAPSNLRAVSGDQNRIDLVWNAATDNVGVTAYRVTRNGATVATIAGTSWSDTLLAKSTKYAYQVVALDAAGNQSAGSNEFDVAWDSSGIGVDTEAPNAPAALTTPAASTGTVDLTWIPSADNVAVTGYRVYRDGMLVKTVKTTSTTDLGLATGKSYEYYIVAIDAAGNISPRSNVVTATTKSGKTRSVRR